MKKYFCMVLFLLVLSVPGLPQNSDDVIDVTLRSSADRFEPGKSYPLEIEIKITPPYHINSIQPSEDYLVPTTVSLEAEQGVSFAEPEFPDAEIRTFGFSTMPMAVYEGSVIVRTRVTLPESFRGPELKIRAVIGYQACDESSCLAPTELPVEQVFPVEGGGEAVPAAAAPIPQESSAVAEEAAPVQERDVVELPDEGGFAGTVGEKGLLLTFLLVFLGGLALNLTPCVYPIIPITIGYFGGQAEGRKGGVVAHAFLYVLGMAVTYSALGLIASLTGSLFGSAMQNPVVLIGIAAVLIGLALSMFNLYEFRLPGFLTNMAGGAKKGYIGTLFMGLTVGIVAAPCIGPFVLGLLTYVGERGDVLLGFLLFFVLALGLGLPFLFLAVFSGSINRLPRSGAWMVWVRTIFGFILVAMAAYFLKPLFPNDLIYSLTLAMILLLGGIYMAWIESTSLGGKAFPLIRNLVGILFFAGALIFAASGIQGYLDHAVQKARMEAGGVFSDGQIGWITFSEELLDQAQEEGRPVFLDFYADWCIPCKELDKVTFPDERVIELSRNFVMMKVDLTKSGDSRVKALRKRYEVKGVPTLVMLDHQSVEVPDTRIVGFIKPEGLIDSMRKTLASTR